MKRNRRFFRQLIGASVAFSLWGLSAIATEPPLSAKVDVIAQSPAPDSAEKPEELTEESKNTQATENATASDLTSAAQQELVSRQELAKKQQDIAQESSETALAEAYRDLALRLKAVLVQLGQTIILESQAQAHEKSLLILKEQRTQAVSLIEQTAARRSRALGRLKQLGLKAKQPSASAAEKNP